MYFSILSTTPGSSIVRVNTITDRSDLLLPGSKFEIRESTGNDGIYTIQSSLFDGSVTHIETVETITSLVPDGHIVGGVFTFNLSGGEFYIAPHEINTTDTSITLVGYGSQQYAEHLVTNDVVVLEGFAADTQPSNPVTGQRWFDTSINNTTFYSAGAFSSNLTFGNDPITLIDPQNGNSDIDIAGNDAAFPDAGLSIRPLVNPSAQESMFRILSTPGVEQFRVEREGLLSVANHLEVSGTIPSYILNRLLVGLTSTPELESLVVSGNMSTDDLDVLLGSTITLGSADAILGGNKIVNLLDPTINQEMSTKKYTDDSTQTVLGMVAGSNLMPLETTLDLKRLGSSVGVAPTVSLPGGFNVDILNLYCFLGGKEWYFSTINYDISTAILDPSNKTIYIYAETVTGVFQINASETPPITSDTSLYLFQVTTDAINTTLTAQPIALSYVGGTYPHPSPRSPVNNSTQIVTSNTTGTVSRGFKITPISTRAGTSHTLQLTDRNSHIMFTSGIGATVTIDQDSSVDFSIGTKITLRHKGLGTLLLTSHPSVTVLANYATSTVVPNTRMILLKEAANVWSVSGDLASPQITQSITVPGPSEGSDGDIALVEVP